MLLFPSRMILQQAMRSPLAIVADSDQAIALRRNAAIAPGEIAPACL